jgi:hypothetical protein
VAFHCGSTPLPGVLSTTPDTSIPWQIRRPRPLMPQNFEALRPQTKHPI